MIFNKGAKVIQWGKASFSINGAGTIVIYVQKNLNWNLNSPNILKINSMFPEVDSLRSMVIFHISIPHCFNLGEEGTLYKIIININIIKKILKIHTDHKLELKS